MDTDKLGRITRRAYLLEPALAGLEAHARQIVHHHGDQQDVVETKGPARA